MNISEELKLDLLKQVKRRRKQSTFWDQLNLRRSTALVSNDIQWIDYNNEKPRKDSKILIRVQQKCIPRKCFDYDKQEHSFCLHDNAFVLTKSLYMNAIYYPYFADLDHLSYEEYDALYPFPFFYQKGFDDNPYDQCLSSDYELAAYITSHLGDIVNDECFFRPLLYSDDSIPLTKPKLSFFDGELKKTRKIWIKPNEAEGK